MRSRIEENMFQLIDVHIAPKKLRLSLFGMVQARPNRSCRIVDIDPGGVSITTEGKESRFLVELYFFVRRGDSAISRT